MKLFRNIAPAALALTLALGGASCADDLNMSVQDEQTNTTFDATGLLAKIYGSLTLTGVEGPSGNPDMSNFDEGNSSFYRRIFEQNELPTDETIWTWQGDAGMPEYTNIAWNSSHGLNELTYYRLEFNITLCNSFLDNTEGTTDATMLRNRAEVRFIRALHFYYFCDLYGKAPFKEHVSDELPVEKSRSDLYSYIESELKAICGDDASNTTEVLADAGSADYGRADKAAAWMLLARLYLNAKVFTGTAQWDNAVTYSTKVISNSGYSLCTDSLNGYSAYEQLFMGDNGENANARKEIIFPIRCDGASTRSYGGSTYTIASTQGSGTPDRGLTSSQWTCNRARQAVVLKFFDTAADVPLTNDVDSLTRAAGDDRALFYSGDEDGAGTNQRTVSTEDKTTFTAGLSIMKWSNLYCDSSNGSPKDVTFPDTDVPFLRVAEAYLTRAEANYRKGANTSDVLSDINTLRSRANASSLTAVSETVLLDEWCREFYFEGRRRSDLIRFGKFTPGSYVWDWKGNSYEGVGVSSIYNLYPIPYSELQANENMTQNTGY